jgi:hypothetical protein
MQTSYPIFESGQVLTSRHLNDLAKYLEEQDRASRNKLIGIGIVCGLEVAYAPKENLIRLSSGCAITSAGYLISLDGRTTNLVRKYELPSSAVEDAPEDLPQASDYSFFMDQEKQMLLWELLPLEYKAGPEKPDPQKIDPGFVKDKVALIFLEARPELLKSCDVNDCSDRGMKIEFTPRILLIERSNVKKIIDREQEQSERPVEHYSHPRYRGFPEVKIDKLNLVGNNIGTFSQLLERISDILDKSSKLLKEQLGRSYDAFAYLLADMYPKEQFPDGPFPAGYFNNVLSQFNENIFSITYLYDFMYDLAQSYNEFLRAVKGLEAECCPNPKRFPFHVLLGPVVEHPTAPPVSLKNANELSKFDPLKINAKTELDAWFPGEAFDGRHYFIPSPLFGREHRGLQEVRSLHYRTFLLAYRFSTTKLFQKELRITPSQAGDYLLSDQAIPFYYAFNRSDDLHANWSFAKYISVRANQIYSYKFSPNTGESHPLLSRLDDQNFYRVEGLVGKGLGKSLRDLFRLKMRLGLSFAVEPVYLGLALEGNDLTHKLDQDAFGLAGQGLMQLLLCRFRDLDVVFLILMAYLFYYLRLVLASLSKFNPTFMMGLSTPATPAEPSPGTATPARPSPGTATPVRPSSADIGVIKVIDRRPLSGIRVDFPEAEVRLAEFRAAPYEKGKVTAKISVDEEPRQSMGKFYAEMKKPTGTANLFDRTVESIRKLDPRVEAADLAGKIYPVVSFLDSTEELLTAVSAPSMAAFDFTGFKTKYDGFVRTFEEYQSFAEKAGLDKKPETVELHSSLLQKYEILVGTGMQAVVGNLITELNKRLQKIFSELRLDGYVKLHPGLEHRSGVPVGGTLVLPYVHKTSFLRMLQEADGDFIKKLNKLHTESASGLSAKSFINEAEYQVGTPAGADPLDQFIVIGDFCLPYRCCDTDCSELVEYLSKPA